MRLNLFLIFGKSEPRVLNKIVLKKKGVSLLFNLLQFSQINECHVEKKCLFLHTQKYSSVINTFWLWVIWIQQSLTQSAFVWELQVTQLAAAASAPGNVMQYCRPIYLVFCAISYLIDFHYNIKYEHMKL